MPIKPTYPGVYVEEIPSGVRTITGVSTSVTAFVDYFKYGRMNRAVQILNLGDFEREFGGLDSNSEASYAIQQFFLNGGTEAWVVRTATDLPEKPLRKAQVDILSGIDGTTALSVEAISEGDWGNNLRVTIDYNTTDPANLFNMNISEFKNVQGTTRLSRSEDFLNLSMDSNNLRYVETVINDEDSGSRLIRVSSTGTARPLQNGTVSGDLPSSVRLTAQKPAVLVTIGTEGTGEALLDIDNTNPSDLTLQNVRSLLEKAIRSSKPDKPAFAAATVELSKNRLRVLAGPTSESSTVSFSKFVNPTLKELKLDSPDSVKGVISGDLSTFSSLTATPPSLTVLIGGTKKIINLTNPTSSDKLGEVRTELENKIREADPTNPAFTNARVSVYDAGTEKRLVILTGLPGSGVLFEKTDTDTTLKELKLGDPDVKPVIGVISGDLTKTFPTLTAPSISMDLKIGSEGPYPVTFANRPNGFKTAREELEKAIQNANTSSAFKTARVALYTPGNQWRLIILAVPPASNISLTTTTADSTTLNDLKLDSPDSAKGVISGDLSTFNGLTASNPSLSVSIGGIIKNLNLTNPTGSDKLSQVRKELENNINAADPGNLAFNNAKVSIYDNNTEKNLIIIAGLPDSDISFAAPNGDTKTLNELGLDSVSRVNSVISKGLTAVPSSLTVTSSISLTIGSEGPHTVTFSEVPPGLPELGKSLENAIQKADTSSVFKTARVALYKPDSEGRLIIAIEDVGDAVTFTAIGDDKTAEELKLTSPPATANVQEYKLGKTAAIPQTAQGAGVEGSNGVPPKGNELIGGGIQEDKKGLYALEDVDLFNILCIPRTSVVSGDNALSPAEVKVVMANAITYCEDRRAIFIVDPPGTITDVQGIKDWVDDNGIRNKNSAIYFPRVKIADQLNEFRLRSFGASGTIAGLYARTDSNRGVWKAPAGTEATLVNVQALDYTLTDGQNGVLNPVAINCLRNFPVYGNICWGARTLDGADQKGSEWKYIPVRRVALYIEESLFRGTQWVVFEPNDEPLWAQIRLNIGAFMHSLFVQGAFQGQTPREAYFVKCDKETTTQDDINKGIVNIVVGFAPLKPAEFVIIQIQQMAGQIQV